MYLVNRCLQNVLGFWVLMWLHSEVDVIKVFVIQKMFVFPSGWMIVVMQRRLRSFNSNLETYEA